jgi:hypothetical protein
MMKKMHVLPKKEKEILHFLRTGVVGEELSSELKSISTLLPKSFLYVFWECQRLKSPPAAVFKIDFQPARPIYLSDAPRPNPVER